MVCEAAIFFTPLAAAAMEDITWFHFTIQAGFHQIVAVSVLRAFGKRVTGELLAGYGGSCCEPIGYANVRTDFSRSARLKLWQDGPSRPKYLDLGLIKLIDNF